MMKVGAEARSGLNVKGRNGHQPSYANIVTLGIRKLVDHDAKTGSVWSLIQKIENRPDLLTRELYVCNDGLPFYDNAFGSVVATADFSPMEYLDQPWVTPQNIPALEQHRRATAKIMDDWADADPFTSPA
ncbi:hypothetical protein [Pseudomonas sp. XP1]